MSELFSRFKAKLKEIYYETPLPSVIKKLEPKHPLEGRQPRLCEICHPNNDPNEFVLPDDFRDIKLEKTNKVYHIQLKDIAPHQWMLVGTNLRNMAFKDPEYGHEADGEPMPMEPLPPPPEPTEYIKSLGLLISVNLKNLSWVEVEELGELFYDLGWTHRKEYDMDDYEGLPREFSRCDELPASDAEDFEDELFDPIKRIEEEITEVKRVTNSDVLPGLENIPFKDDAETWLETPHPNPPWEDVPHNDFVSEGKIYPLQSEFN